MGKGRRERGGKQRRQTAACGQTSLAWPTPAIDIIIWLGRGLRELQQQREKEEEAQQHKEREIEKKEQEQRLQGKEELAKEKRLLCAECEQSIMIYNCPTGSLGLDIPLHAS